MIAALMLYSVAITLLLGVAAVACEYVLRLMRWPARVAWMVALLAAVGFSAARFRGGWVTAEPPANAVVASPTFAALRTSEPRFAPTSVRSPRKSSPAALYLARAIVARARAVRIVVASGSTVSRLDPPLVITWLVLSIVGLIVMGLSAHRLARPRPRWSTTVVDGVPVFVSHDLGPAVIGLFRYRIVLPAWALQLAPVERDLVLAHEREHAAAGDPSLLFVATLLVILYPWNAALWWMARRLRFAIELDCDARVLRTRPDRCAYGALLLDVSERTLGGAMPVAALAEPVSLVERRIAAMMGRVPRFVFLRSVLCGALATTLIIAACAAPHPASAPPPSNVSRGASRPDTAMSATIAERDSLRRLSDQLRAQLASLDSAHRLMIREAGASVTQDAALVKDSALYSDLGVLMRRLQALNDNRVQRSGLDTLLRAYAGDTLLVRARSGGFGESNGGAFLRNPWGATDSTYPRVILDDATLGASVTRDSANWGRARASAIAGGFGVGGGVATGAGGSATSRGVTGGVTGGVASGVAGGWGTASDRVGFADMDRRAGRLRDLAVKYFPDAFDVHENELHLIVLVFDSTGSLVKMGRKTRTPPLPGENLLDRDVLRLVMPTVSINSLFEWGLMDLSTTQQSRASGVTVMYGFTGRAPW